MVINVPPIKKSIVEYGMIRGSTIYGIIIHKIVPIVRPNTAMYKKSATTTSILGAIFYEYYAITNPIHIIVNGMISNTVPSCSKVFLPYFFINSVVKEAVMAGNKVVKMGTILLRSGSTSVRILPPYITTGLIPINGWIRDKNIAKCSFFPGLKSI